MLSNQMLSGIPEIDLGIEYVPVFKLIPYCTTDIGKKRRLTWARKY